MGGGDVLRPRAVGRDPRRPRPRPDNPATPAPPDGARKARIEAFAAKEDVDEASLLAVVADIKAEVERDHRLHRGGQGRPGRRPGAVRHDVQAVRRRPAAGAQPERRTRSCGWPASSSTTRSSSSSSTRRALQQLVRGEGPAADGEAWVQRLSMLGGVALVVLATRVGPARRRLRRRLRLGSGSRGRRRGGGDRVAGADGDARPPGAAARRGRR